MLLLKYRGSFMDNYTNAQLVTMIIATNLFLVLPGLVGWFFELRHEHQVGFEEYHDSEDQPELPRAA
jgi:hypothetical protein